MYKLDTIFIQIASYRDTELIPTILDSISKAKYPERLSFGVCVQDDLNNDGLIDLFYLHDNLRAKFFHYKDSKGACWARSIAQSLYRGEDFSLQIDSHMRFVKDWDTKLISMWKSLNDSKGLLTAYPGKYYPDQPENTWPKEKPTVCNVIRIHDGKFKQLGVFMEDDIHLTKPKRGVALSAAYIFTTGKCNIEVPYNPNLYFDGEEMDMCLRYYTNGYNIYHPHKVYLYHYWTRDNYKHHWDDHEDWGELESLSLKHIHSLITNNTDVVGEYCLGNVRTIIDYEKYAGINFDLGIVHKYRRENYEPPVKYPDDLCLDHSNKVKTNVNLTWDVSLIKRSNDITFWHIKVKDNDDIYIYSEVIGYNEHTDLFEGIKNEYEIQIELNTKYQSLNSFEIHTYTDIGKWSTPHIFSLKTV